MLQVVDQRREGRIDLAGGGIRGGQVIGGSNADGTEVKDRPVTVPDLLASICHALKVDPTKETMTPIGRPIKVVDGGKTVRELFGGTERTARARSCRRRRP